MSSKVVVRADESIQDAIRRFNEGLKEEDLIHHRMLSTVFFKPSQRKRWKRRIGKFYWIER